MRTVSLPRGRYRLHAMPTSTGYEIRTDASYDWDGRSAGKRPLRCCSTRWPAPETCITRAATTGSAPGETLLVLVPHNHRYWLEQGGRWEFFWISMNGDEAVRIHAILVDDRTDV